MNKKQNCPIHQISLNSIQDVNPQIVGRFIDNALQHQPIDGNDAFDVALLLQALSSGASKDINMNATLRRVLGIARKKRRKKHQYPDSFRCGGDAWKIVERKVRGEITRAEGLRLFESEINSDVDDSTRARWFDELVPQVEDYFATLENMTKLIEGE